MGYQVHVKELMAGLKGKPPVPVELWILTDLLNIPASDIAKVIKRSANQVSYYRTGVTAIPSDVRADLIKLIGECQRMIMEGTLPSAAGREYRKALLALIKLHLQKAE